MVFNLPALRLPQACWCFFVVETFAASRAAITCSGSSWCFSTLGGSLSLTITPSGEIRTNLDIHSPYLVEDCGTTNGATCGVTHAVGYSPSMWPHRPMSTVPGRNIFEALYYRADFASP